MSGLRTLKPVSILCIAAAVLSSCVAGNLPTIRTQQIDVQDVGGQGLTLRVALTATNERVSDTIAIDGLRVNVHVNGQDLGTVDVAEAWQLPPNQPVPIETNVTVPLPNLPELVLAGAGGPIPYHLSGTAHVQNVGWSVSFAYDGYIPQEQLLGAATRALPIGLPFP